MTVGNRITRHQAMMLAAKEIAEANIRGFHPTTVEALLKEVEQDPSRGGFSACWEWAFQIQAYLSVSFNYGVGEKGKLQMEPRIEVNWPAGARPPTEAQVSLQLYQLVTDLACRIQVMLSKYIIEGEK